MRPIGIRHIAWAKSDAQGFRYGMAHSSLCTPDLAAMGLPAEAGLPASAQEIVGELATAIADRVSAPGGRVVITAGASEANACVFAAMLSPGDQVLAERPGYEPFRAVPPMFGAEVKTFERPRATDFGGFTGAIEAQLTERTHMVVVSHLHNPSAAALSDQDAQALDALAEKHGLWILCDEAFRDAGSFPLGTMASCGRRWIATGSLTKCYGLGGLRIGWVAGPPQVLERCAGAETALSGEVALPSVSLALKLMPHLDTLRERGQQIFKTNRARLDQTLARCEKIAPGELDPVTSPRGATLWCLMNDGGGDAFADFAARRFDLAVTPGHFFDDSRGIRLSLGAEPEAFAEAAERFRQAFEAYVDSRKQSGATA